MSKGLHPNNPHNALYNFEDLCKTYPALKAHLIENTYGNTSVNYFDPKAVKALNTALLFHFYKIKYWEFPDQYLCPPIPGRVDYLHHLNDFLNKPKSARILDIGTGANCIYPLLGASAFNWNFLASDVNKEALEIAETIIQNNPSISSKVETRLQSSNKHIFKGIIKPDDYFDCTICNPPFHVSAKEAALGSLRKLKNLKGQKNPKLALNFAGQHQELWCEGGELSFVKNMISESTAFAENCRWFTSLISKESNLKPLYACLKNNKVAQFKTINMAQGNKQSRFIAWRFQ